MTDDLTALDSQIDFELLRTKYKPLRDEVITSCKVCGNPTGSPLKQTCSNACRQALYRVRLKVRVKQSQHQQTAEAV